MASSRSGDWTCRCGKLNFRIRDKCVKCDTFKSKSIRTQANGTSSSSSSNVEPGDWKCANPNCTSKSLNFKSRESCRACGEPRDRSTEGILVEGRGWSLSNRALHQKKESESQLSESDTGVQQEPGDWMCTNTNCNSAKFNFKRRTDCLHCGAPKTAPKPDPIVPIISPSSSYNSDECIVCMDNDRECLPPCHHWIMCWKCCATQTICPTCKAPYTMDQVTPVYKS